MPAIGGQGLVVAALLCAMVSMAAAWSGSNLAASYHLYSPDHNGWDLNSVNAYCAPWDANKPLWWRKQYGWVALCEQWGSSNYCGKCIKVTNSETGAWIVARIVDKCSDGGLKLDYDDVFKKIDTDGHGYKNSYLTVDYKIVAC
ncbi:unnamed protein product [Urochloa decumbens]|uniref:Barwin domain-containing protein n=1 Tax=Urochloa decumbens TaxID=240449 RepID=A0ABC9AWI9_9POAL